MQSLSMAHCIGQPGQPLPVYRLVACDTVEERVQQLVDKRKGAESAFKSAQRSALACCCRLHTSQSSFAAWTLQE